MTPMALLSLTAKIAVGRSGRSSSVRPATSPASMVNASPASRVVVDGHAGFGEGVAVAGFARCTAVEA